MAHSNFIINSFIKHGIIVSRVPQYYKYPSSYFLPFSFLFQFAISSPLQSSKQLLRNIGCTILSNYLTTASQRQQLGYPIQCQPMPINPKIYSTIRNDCLGLKCITVSTKEGQKLCRVVIVSLKEQPIFDRWFGIGDENVVLDLRPHLSGIDNQVFKQKIQNSPAYAQINRKEIEQLIKSKIIVGHDLFEDLKHLQIVHSAFIDTVSLIPHHFGLPLKNKIKDLAFNYLKRHIQWAGPDVVEDSKATLEIVQKHIQNGRGTIQIQPCSHFQYQNNFIQIIKDAELNQELILMFVLRGSRALGIQMDQQYKSDWDYIAVYDVQSELDGRLIKLPNVDISFFDRQSFDNHLKNNDISYIESFFIDEKFVLVNKIRFPSINIEKLRASLGFHLNKSRLKIRRFLEEVSKNPTYNWKVLKAYHLQLRFLDLFLQIFEFCKSYELEGKNCKQYMTYSEQYPVDISEMRTKINIKKMNTLWQDIKAQYQETRDIQRLKLSLEKKIQLTLGRVNQRFPKFKNKNCRQVQRQKFLIKQRIRQKSLQKQKIIHSNIQSSSFLRSNFDGTKHEAQNQQSLNGQVADLLLSPNHNKENLAQSKLSTVNFLRSHQIFELSSYKVNWKRHKVFPNLVQLHYMMSADFRQQISIQCRGLILDESRNFEVVAYPYNKFFDYNDPSFSQVSKIDWKSAKVYEKKDGSIAFLYFYNGLWNVASSSVPDGENSYCFAKKQTTTQFKNQFWSIFNCLQFSLPESSDRNKTFVFQLMSKNHTIVVKREASQLCLHGVRNIDTLQQEDHLPYGKKYNWVVAEPIQMHQQDLNIDNLVKMAEKLDPLQSEGFVICDKNWRRVKIKNSKYVRINWLGELNLGFNKDPKKYILIEIIMSGEAEVFCKYCPEWSHVIKHFLAKISKLNKQVIQIYEPIKELDKKQFAQSISKYSSIMRSFLFSIRSSPSKYFGKVQYCISPKKFYDFLIEYI